MQVMQGKVVSLIGDKTAKVVVERKWQHPLYKKFVKRSKSYLCHVEGEMPQIGTTVSIQGCRPMSKSKVFKITGERENRKTGKQASGKAGKQENGEKDKKESKN